MLNKSQIFSFLLFVLSFCSCSGNNPSSDVEEVKVVLQQQEKAWNNGDLEEFMQGYWQSDSLRFVGKKGITYGWEQTLKNYRKGYPNRAAMGKLTFTINDTENLGNGHVLVIGAWELKREAGNVGGHFSLIFRKIAGKWVIITDHTS